VRGARLAGLGAVSVVSALGAAAATVAWQDDGAVAPATTTTALPPSTAPAPAAVGAGQPGVLLAWAQAGLPDAAVAAVHATPGVRAVAVVRDGRADLVRSTGADGVVVDEPPDGFVIGLDVAAVHPPDYAQVVPAADRAALAELGPGEALLGETSAGLRRIGPGGRLELAGGTTLEVVAVVPDEAVGAAEVVVDRATGEAIGIRSPRAALVAHDGDRTAVERAVAGAAVGTPVRFRAPGETPFLRAADAVLPQALLKAVYGEFAHRAAGPDSRDVEVDPEWVAANIVDADVPVLGSVRCHRAVVDALRAAMHRIEVEGLGDEVAAGGYDGCWVPRFVRPGGSLSRHAWGIAFDVGFEDNPTAVSSSQDPRVVDALLDAGFAWGGTWLVPDPAHFEAVARL
jgi:hypothetical protein